MKNCKSQDNPEDQCKFSEVQIRKPRVLAYSRLSTDLGKMKAMVDSEKNEGFKTWMTEQMERVAAASECKSDVKCWLGKTKDKSPRVRERAAYALAWAATDGSAEAQQALLEVVKDEDNETRYAAIIGLGRRLPKDPGVADTLAKQIAGERGKTQFIRVNEDLKRLEVRVRRGY